MTAIQGYHETLLPHLNEPQQTDRPLALRKTSDTHSFQLVKHCNNEVNLKNKKILQLITSLISILLQVFIFFIKFLFFCISCAQLALKKSVIQRVI